MYQGARDIPSLVQFVSSFAGSVETLTEATFRATVQPAGHVALFVCLPWVHECSREFIEKVRNVILGIVN